MVFDPFLYKDGKDFLNKTKMTHDAAISFLNAELKKRQGVRQDEKQSF